MKKAVSELLTREEPKFNKPAAVGLVVVDTSLRPIAIDRGASAILKFKTSGALIKPEPFAIVRKAMLETFGQTDFRDVPPTKMTFHIGGIAYNCRAYVMEANGGYPAMIGLHLERVSSMNDAISALAAKYTLTEREEETLRGVSMGLSSKQLASRMNISPNTVKVFLRLIMIKMGVSSRGAMIAQILQQQSAPEEAEPQQSAAKA